MKYLVLLGGRAKMEEIGAKAHTLMKLHKADFDVPIGFCVKTCVFDYYKKNNDLPKDFTSELGEMIEFLMIEPPVVVRSSSTLEDSKKHSFAGLFESVVNAYDIEEAILKVFESSNSEKVKIYLSKMKIKRDIKMGVLVQKQIIGKYSGVAFTRDPTNFEDRVVIEYVEGPAWNLVSGKVSPKREKLKEPCGTFSDLWKLCKDIEQFFRTPQDIEWISKR